MTTPGDQPGLPERAYAGGPERRGRGASFDPSVFDDPLALRLDWNDASGTASSFAARRLVEVDADRLEVRPTRAARILPGFFFVVAAACVLGAGGAMLAAVMTGGAAPTRDTITGLLIAAGLACIPGFILLAAGGATTVIDRAQGTFRRGRRGRGIPLTDVHAVQLLMQSRSQEVGRASFRLGLVRARGGIEVLMNQPDAPQMRNDAARLAAFLDVPLWDATRRPER